MPFDHFERHTLTRAAADVVREKVGHETFRVLDVGGGPASLSRFLPHDYVVTVDTEDLEIDYSALGDESFMRADGTKLPFADGAFEIVVCHDTLEHVPADLREAFLHEMLRVASELVLVNGPFDTEDVSDAERLVIDVARETMGDGYATVHYLSEHAEFGLPDLQQATAALESQGSRTLQIPNGALSEWVAKMLVKHHAERLGPHGLRPFEFDRWSNEAYAPVAEAEPTYRHAIITVKRRDNDLFDALAERLGAWEDPKPESSPRVRSDAVRQAVERLDAMASAALAEKDDHARNLERLSDSLRRQLQANEQRVATLEDELRRTSGELYALREQMSTFGYRAVDKLRRGIDTVAPRGTRRRLPFMAAGRAGRIVMNEGVGALVSKAAHPARWAPTFRQGPASGNATQLVIDQYDAWLAKHSPTPARIRKMKQRLATLDYQPLISIVMPTYNTKPSWLQEAVDSVKQQIYDNWEICIADDGSTNEETLSALRALESDSRIKIKLLDANGGISAASNAALELATGEFVGLLDHDDELRCDALYWIVRRLNEDRNLDFIYTDEDKKELGGRRTEPFFKPDWSPDLEMSVNYVTHFSVFRREIIDRAGGFRSGYDGSQDYDLVLRVMELTDKIAHVAKPLYTWRRVPGSTAAEPHAKEFAIGAAKLALKDALERRGYEGEVSDGLVQARYRVRYAIKDDPSVTIIIPTRDRVDMLRRAVDSIRQKSTYANYEIMIVDNDSEERETLDYLESCDARVFPYPGEFHYSRMNNTAAREAGGDYILFLNNDTEIITPDWIESMLEHAQRKEVAAVGARLFYPTGAIQHEGVIMGIAGGSAGNVDHGGYFGLGETIRNCSAVTAACMMTRADAFWDLGGFDEQLRVAFNDVDFCLRARQKGYQIVYTPYAQLYHYESASRGSLHPMEDEQFFRDRWGNPGDYKDPYYNPNLDILRPFTLRV